MKGRKYEPGHYLISVEEVMQAVNGGDFIYLGEKILHPSFVLSMRLKTISDAVRGKRIRIAEKIREY